MRREEGGRGKERRGGEGDRGGEKEGQGREGEGKGGEGDKKQLMSYYKVAAWVCLHLLMSASRVGHSQASLVVRTSHRHCSQTMGGK